MSDLVERSRFLAAGQDDPHSATITELCNRIEALEAALREIEADNYPPINGSHTQAAAAIARAGLTGSENTIS